MGLNLWSKAWKSSTQRRKQRKYSYNAPLHIKHRMISVSLSKDLRKQYGTRSIPVRKGDTVVLKAGQFKNQSGKVTKVSLARTKVFVDGVGLKRTDGTLSLYPVHPSNLEISKLDLSDKLRVDKIESFKKGKKVEEKKNE